MRRDTIIIGGQEFAGRTILDGNCFVSRSLPCDELTVDTLSATLDGSERRGTRFIPRGSSGMRTSDNQIFTVRPYFRVLVNDLTVYGYGEPVLYYHDGKLIGRFYMEKPRRVGKYSYEITCVSAVGLLDNSTHYGDIYNGVPIEAVLADIIGGVIPYTLDPVFADTPIYGGWLPVASRRSNLHQLLFAVGGSAGKDANGELYITALSAKDPAGITDDRLFLGGSIDYGTPITAAEISEHTYISYAGDSTATLYEGKVPADPVRSPRGALLAGALVTFDGPMHDLVIEGGSILESGVNYAVLGQAAACKLTGQQYTHTTRIVRAEKPVSRGLVSVSDNTARVTDATLVTLANSENVAQRVLAYYGYTRTVSTDMVVGKERPGTAVSFTDPFDESAEGFVKSMDIRMGGLLKAAAQLVAGYIPPDIGNFYKHSVVLTGNGIWTSPVSGKIRFACISGGTGGYSGRKGKSGKVGEHESINKKVPGEERWWVAEEIHPGEWGEGGVAGEGGEGGRVNETTMVVTLGQQFTYACGVGGGGGAQSASVDDSTPGSAGTETRFGTVTSAEGLVYPAGYRNIITGELFAAQGATGINGGNGQGVPDSGGGNPIVYEGITFVAGSLGKEFYASFSGTGVVVEGGFGGGAAVGANGLVAPDASGGRTNNTVTALGFGGKGATPIAAKPQTVLGCGGHGGHGGGGGGANPQTETGEFRYASSTGTTLKAVATPGDGGLGGAGGVAAGGCIVIYYG